MCSYFTDVGSCQESCRGAAEEFMEKINPLFEYDFEDFKMYYSKNRFSKFFAGVREFDKYDDVYHDARLEDFCAFTSTFSAYREYLKRYPEEKDPL